MPYGSSEFRLLRAEILPIFDPTAFYKTLEQETTRLKPGCFLFDLFVNQGKLLFSLFAPKQCGPGQSNESD